MLNRNKPWKVIITTYDPHIRTEICYPVIVNIHCDFKRYSKYFDSNKSAEKYIKELKSKCPSCEHNDKCDRKT